MLLRKELKKDRFAWIETLTKYTNCMEQYILAVVSLERAAAVRYAAISAERRQQSSRLKDWSVKDRNGSGTFDRFRASLTFK